MFLYVLKDTVLIRPAPRWLFK